MKRDELPSLLLLPFPPDPLNRPALSAAYRPPLAAAISKLKNPARHSRLIIAVACPILSGRHARQKEFSWPEAQSLLAGIYTLVAIICAGQSIATEADGGPGSVESTVILIDHDRKRRFPPERPAIETNNTVILDLQSFASAYFPWNYIFHVRTEAGLQLNQTYLIFAEAKQTLLQDQLVPVEGGLTMHLVLRLAEGFPSRTRTYPTVCLGGTFDHLHPGHKLLLTAGALLLGVPKAPEPSSSETLAPCRFIIGVTGDELLKNKKYAEQVQPWDDRARAVLRFLTTLLHVSPRGWKDAATVDNGPPIEERDGDFRVSFRDGTITVQCVRIQDAFGPTVTLQDIDVLVVSGETRSGGKAVNDRRTEQGWRPLEVFEVDVLDVEEIPDGAIKAENYEAKISSTAIRKQRAEQLQNSKG